MTSISVVVLPEIILSLTPEKDTPGPVPPTTFKTTLAVVFMVGASFIFVLYVLATLR